MARKAKVAPRNSSLSVSASLLLLAGPLAKTRAWLQAAGCWLGPVPRYRGAHRVVEPWGYLPAFPLRDKQ